jgi:hypothetical protein
LRLSYEELIAYDEDKRRVGDRANKAYGVPREDDRVGRSVLQVSLRVPLSLRGRVRECALVLSDAGVFSKDLLAYTYADLQEQFDTPKNCSTHCTSGCARTASTTDEWRSQRGLSDAPRTATAS